MSQATIIHLYHRPPKKRAVVRLDEARLVDLVCTIALGLSNRVYHLDAFVHEEHYSVMQGRKTCYRVTKTGAYLWDLTGPKPRKIALGQKQAAIILRSGGLTWFDFGRREEPTPEEEAAYA